MGIERLFSTPLAVEQMDPRIDVGALRRKILAERERDPAGYAASNIGSWHSAHTLQHWGGDDAVKLGKQVAAIADAMTASVADPQAQHHAWQVDVWANIVRAGDMHQLHFHPGCVWSAVAYVDDGFEGSDDPAMGGQLCFLDPRMPMMQMNAQHLLLRGSDGKPQSTQPEFRPRTGAIVIFPAWLGHWVKPFRGEGTRISVAMNLSAG